jgi:flagellar hook-associated protein 1 FlgK
VSDVFGISVTALQAFQQAIDVTSNNVANASTPGYDEESINLSEAIPQANGSATIGSGVAVTGITRAYSQAATNQLNTSQSTLGQLTSLQNYTSQIDNLVGTTGGGLSTALTTYYSAWSNVSDDPTSTASRQALISAAQGVATSLQSTSSQLNTLSANVNAGITADVTQINSLAGSISTLNQQIVLTQGQSGGQAPNELLDQRDQAVSTLSGLVGVTTTSSSDGSLNVFVGNGQPLVVGGQVTQLTTVADQYDASQLDVSSTSANGNVIDSALTTGDLGGLLAARTQAINPALNQLGQIATAIGTSANTQQSAGVDLNGAIGTPIFSSPTPTAVASVKNTGTGAATVAITDVGALTANNYVLTYKGGAYSLATTDGTHVPLTGTGTAANPLTADGISITVTGAPAANDTFLIQPTASTAANFAVAIANPSQVAAASAITASAASTNAGAATVNTGTVIDPANPALTTPASIVFATPTTYSINGGAVQTLAASGDIEANGWEVQISGTPAAGDTFTVGPNTGGSGDNRNALLSAAQQTTGILNGATTSTTGAVSALITGIGSQAAQINTAQTAQTAVNTSASNNVASISGVNLDEEAANLLKWQQAYQASAQALTIGNSLFTTLIDSVNGTYS